MDNGATGHNGLAVVKLVVTGQQREQGNVTILLHLEAVPLVRETQNKLRIAAIVCIVQVGDTLNGSIHYSSHFISYVKTNVL